MSRPTLPSWLPHLTLLGLAAVASAVEPSSQAKLRWRNGDELTGKLLEGTEGRVRFSAAPFTAPFDLSPAQLAGLRFEAAAETPEPSNTPLFEISLKNGDKLRGRLLSVDHERLTFQCEPLAEPVSIRRSETVRLARVSADGTGLSGLGELDEWTSMGRDRKTSDWFTDLRGELATHQWSGNLFREIALPEQVEVQFRARFPAGRPNLEVGLLRDPSQGPMLETWDNFLVLTHHTQFSPVMELADDLRELHLRFFWNQRTGEAIVCDPSGKRLASLSGDTPAQASDSARRASDPLRRGFSILSRNSEMTLLSLEVRQSDGKPAPVIDLTRPRLHLRDSAVRFNAEEITLTAGSDRLRLGGETRPIGDLVEWILAPEPEKPHDEKDVDEVTRIAWMTGTSLSGDFVGIGPEGMVMRPPWTEAPVTATLAGAREVRFPDHLEPLGTGSDTLVVGGITLRGNARLSAATGEVSPALLAWQPPGAASAVPFVPGAEIFITRSPHLDADAEPPVSLGQARLYLDNDEILAGKLISLTAEKVTFESRITGRIEVAADQVRAIDIGTSGRLLEGFRDTEWEEIGEVEDSVVLTPDSVTMRDGGFGNPSILLGDRIRFDAEWQESYGAMTLRLFASGPDTGNPSTDVIIAAQGNRLFIGKLNESGAFSFSGDQIPIVNNRASIDVSARPDEVEIRINGKSSLTLKVEPDKVSGNGIYFKMGGGWQGWNQAESTIVISKFRIECSPGSVPRRVIDPRAKAHTLAIPRSMREQAPTHLLVAPNGDLLRGKLTSADGELLQFHANGAHLEIPRSRVASIVRLDPPVAAPTSPIEPPLAPGEDEEEEEEENEASNTAIAPYTPERRTELAAFQFDVSHQLVLRDGSRLRLAGESVAENRLVGQSPILGKCRVSLEQVREISIAPPTRLENAKPMDLVVFQDWAAYLTPDPAIPDAGGAPTSPLIGKEAPPFELSMLDDSVFRLAEHRGKVVVLDFWATWCGPCIKAMPDVIAAVTAFPPEAVTFCAVNQAETPPLVTSFLEAREWQDTPVALDFNLKVSQSYEVEGIPHTVVIDPEGKIAWVHSGFSPELKKKLFEAIATVLSR